MAEINLDLKVIPEVDLKELNQMLQNIKKSMLSLNQKLTVVDKEKVKSDINAITQTIDNLKTNMSSVGKVTPNTTYFDTLKTKIAETQKSINQMQSQYMLMAKSGSKGTEYQELGNRIKEARAELAKMKAEIGGSDTEANKLNNTFKKVTDQGSLLGKMFMFNQVSQSIQTLASSFDQLSQPFVRFEASLADFSALTGVSGEALDEFGNKAKELATQFGGSTTSQIESFKGILSRFGPDIAKSPEALERMAIAVNTLSKASGLDATTAMDALTTGILQFNVSLDDPIAASAEMTRQMNIMAAGAKEGAAEIPQISEALKVTGVAASSANVSFEETNAALQALAAGGKNGAEAGTALRNVLGMLQKQSGPGTAQLQAMGLSVEQLGTALNEKGLSSSLKLLQKGFESIQDPAAKNAALIQLFGRENSAAAGILLRSADSIETLTAKISGTSVAYDQAQVNMNTTASAMDRFKASFENTMIGLFDTVGGGITTVVGSLSTMSPAIMSISGLTPILGSLGKQANNAGLSLATKFAPNLLKTKTITDAAGNAITKTGLSMKSMGSAIGSFITSPAGIAIAALAALVIATKAISDAVNETAAERKAEAEESLKANKSQQELVANQIKQAQNNLGLVDSFKTLGSAQQSGVKNSDEYKQKMVELSQAYPGVIDQNKTYEDNLRAVELAAKETQTGLTDMQSKLDELSNQEMKLKIEIAQENANEVKEGLENTLTDVMSEWNWNNAVSGTMASPQDMLSEWLFGTSRQRNKAEEYFSSLTKDMYNASSKSGLDKAFTDAQIKMYNSDEYKSADTKSKNAMISGLKDFYKKQVEVVETNATIMSESAKQGLIKLLSAYDSTAKEINKLEIKVQSGTATNEEIAQLDKLKQKQIEIKNEIQKRAAEEAKSGKDINLVIDALANRYGITKNEVQKILGLNQEQVKEQQKLKGEVEETTEAAKEMGEAFDIALKTAQGGIKQAQSGLAGAINDMGKSMNIDNIESFGTNIVNALDQGVQAVDKYNISMKETTTLTDAQNKALSILPDYQNKNKKSAEKSTKEQKSAYELALKQLNNYKSLQDYNNEMVELENEKLRIQQKREKSTIDELATSALKLSAIEDEKQKFLELFQITLDEKGNIANIGIKTKDEDKDKIKNDFQNLTKELTQETNKNLDLKAKLSVEDKDYEDKIKQIEFEQLKKDVELGIKNPDLLFQKWQEEYDKTAKEIAQNQVLIDEYKNTNTKLSALDEANLKDKEQKNIALNDKLKKIDNDRTEYKINTYNKEFIALQELHQKELAEFENKIANEKKLQDLLISTSANVLSISADVDKEGRLAELEQLKTAESITEEDYNKQKEEIEQEHQNRLLTIQELARGSQLEAERQQTLKLLKEKEARIQSELAIVKPETDPEKYKQLSTQLSNIQEEVKDKGDILQTYSGELQAGVTDIFSNIFNADEDTLKAPWRKILAVTAGGLKQYLSLLVTELVFGEVSKYSSTGLIALLLIPALTGIINAALSAILDPVLASIASFSSGGEVNHPTLSIVGDADGSDSTEWIFNSKNLWHFVDEAIARRDAEIKKMFADLLPKINDTIKNNLTNNDFWKNFQLELTQLEFNRLQNEINDDFIDINKDLTNLADSIQKIKPLFKENDFTAKNILKLSEKWEELQNIENQLKDNQISENEYYDKMKGFETRFTEIENIFVRNVAMMGNRSVSNAKFVLDNPQFKLISNNNQDKVVKELQQQTKTLEGKLDYVIQTIEELRLKGVLMDSTAIAKEVNRYNNYKKLR
jgi:TP901 family phage tail tape measure protein